MNGTPPTRLAFIGLGHMGGHMCRNLITAGFGVSAFDLDPAVLARGARPARDVADCARQADILMTSLPGPPQVEEVLCGAAGAIAAMSPGALVVEMSTPRWSPRRPTRRFWSTMCCPCWSAAITMRAS